MGILRIGRVGADITLDDPANYSEQRNLDSRSLTLRGFLRAATLADTKVLRSELLEQQGQLVAVTYSLDSYFDAYYILTDVSIGFISAWFWGGGLFTFESSFFRIGSDSRTELQSLLSGATVTNSHSITAEFWHATPPGALAYSIGGAAPVEASRTTEDGAIGVYRNIDITQDPSWSVTPANYYKAAVKIKMAGRIRAGQDVPNDPANWEMDNGLVHIRPVTFGGTSTGRFEMRWYDGTVWDSFVPWKIVWNNSVDIPKWHYMSILRNTPEMSTIRLVRDAETAPPSAYRHVLDITLRRGAPFIAFYYTYTGGVGSHAVARDSSDAATAGTGFIKDSSTIDGNRWMLGSPRTFTADTTNGKISLTAAAQTLPFVIGSAINDAADAPGM